MPPDFLIFQSIRKGDTLEFFKALADANRLKIIGLLAQDEYAVEQIAEMLNLRPSTVSQHLSKLSKVRLVSARSKGYYNTYRIMTREGGGGEYRLRENHPK